MSLTIAYLTPRYTIGRFPKEEGPVPETRITRSIASGSDLLKSVQTTCQWACWTCRQLRDGASFDSCCFMPAGRGTPLPPVATRAAQAIARQIQAGLLRLGTACFSSASCYLDCLIIVGQS
jgi:hypothetical protein